MAATALLALAGTAEAKDGRKGRSEARETPYSNRAVAREREARRIDREIQKDRAEQRRKERAYRAWDADEDEDEEVEDDE